MSTITLPTPLLMLVRGLPGSGKTYLATQLKHDLEQKLGDGTVLMLDPDAINYESEGYLQAKQQFAAQGIEEKFYPYRYLRGKAERAIVEDKIVIWNQPFTLRGGVGRTIAHLTEIATAHNKNLTVVIVEVAVSPETAKARIKTRKKEGGHGPSDTTFNRFVGEYVSFADMGYPTVAVRGEDDAMKSVDAIEEALKPLK